MAAPGALSAGGGAEFLEGASLSWAWSPPRWGGSLPCAPSPQPRPPCPTNQASLLQKDLPQPAWVPAAADGPQPRADSDTTTAQQPPGQEALPASLPAEQSPEPPVPKETEASAPPREPESPTGLTPKPAGLPDPSA